MDFKAIWETLWMEHRGKTAGLLLGVCFGVGILLVGFFKTVFVLFCGALGLFIGKKIDDEEDMDLRDIFSKILPPTFRR